MIVSHKLAHWLFGFSISRIGLELYAGSRVYIVRF